jgi:hypothetical protein
VTSIEPVTQPRVDTLVTDVATGDQRRRTEYSGTIWLGGRPVITSGMTMSTGAGVVNVPPFFLPDSLPYKRDAVGDGIVAATVAVQSDVERTTITDAQAAFVDDPGVGGRCWIQIAVTVAGRGPIGLSYRVVALTAPDAVDRA